MSREIIRLYRKSGPLFTGQYLKQVGFLLMWYTGGDRAQSPKMKTYVSLTRSGIPRIIPPMYRKLIRDGKDPLVVKVVLSVCTLWRLILVPPKGGIRMNPETIVSRGFRLADRTKEVCQMLASSAYSVLRVYAQGNPLEVGIFL